jgi:hypothetical protein
MFLPNNKMCVTKIKMSSRYFFCCLIIFITATLLFAEDSMYWVGNFGPISLGHLTTQADIKTASSSTTLFTTGDCEISADHTVAARLSGPAGCTLITEYKLEFDGDGSGKTGAATVDFSTYDTFLASPLRITHVPYDDDVVITLSVRARNNPNNLADAGDYTAAQTLTVHWVGP